MTNHLAKKPSFTNSGHPELSALRVNGEEQFLDIVTRSIQANRGVLKDAAEAMNISRQTIGIWVKHYPELKIVAEQAKEKAKEEDLAEKESM